MMPANTKEITHPGVYSSSSEDYYWIVKLFLSGVKHRVIVRVLRQAAETFGEGLLYCRIRWFV